MLFEATHPQHVHMFKHAARALLDGGHAVKITSRDKDGVPELLDQLGLEHEVLSSGGRGLLGLGREMLLRDLRLRRVARRFGAEAVVGNHAVFAAQVSWLLSIPSIIFDDLEKQPLSHLLTNRFATVILTPRTYKLDLGPAQVRYDGCPQLLHLHPNRFKPDAGVLERAGLAAGEPFFVLRLVSWGANHDLGQSGLDGATTRRLIGALEGRGRVFVSSERPLTGDMARYGIPVPRSQIHHLMRFARLYVGESSTMGAEAALLGTPAVVCNTLDHGFLEELQNKYGLVFRHRTPQGALAEVERLLAGGLEGTDWKARHDRLIADKTDITALLLEIVALACRIRDTAELRRRCRESAESPRRGRP